MVLPSPQFEFGEGSNKSTDTRNLGLRWSKSFVKNGRHPFLGKLDAKEAFLWILLLLEYLGVWHANGAPCRSLRMRLGYGEINLWAPPLKVANLRMSLGINSRLSLKKSTS